MQGDDVPCLLCDAPRTGVFDALASLRVCGRCGHVFAHPLPSETELAAFYSRRAKYDAWLENETAREAMWRRRLALILPRVPHKGRLLDIGAGTGQFLKQAREHFEQVAGTEISDSAIRIGRDRYGLDIRHGTLSTLEFDTGSFDLITLFHVLEHVGDPGRVVARCRDLLKPGGVLVLAVPNERGLARQRLLGVLKFALRLARLRRFRHFGWKGIPRIALDGTQDEIHLSYFTAHSLTGLLDRTGFSIEAMSLDPFWASAGPRGCG
ncbi:MAG: class I SAM-dependent methyltransferase, partial [Lentisphaerae bacterium]|nr:class I SAM-dependent methyltransferase [Lentisphaerota bacterium]